MGAERSFTAFPKLLHVAETIPDPVMRGEFLMGVLRYGTTGEEPCFSWPLDGLFAGVREDIDNSVSARYQNKGGRPRKGATSEAAPCACAGDNPGSDGPGKPETHVHEVWENRETGVSEVSENGETGVSEVSGTGNGGSGKTPGFTNRETQTIPYQAIPNQTMPSEERQRGRPRFSPPSPEEVAAYASEKGLALDAGRFCDFYASKGWKVGSSPMRDWRAAARNWAARGSSREAVRGACDEYSRL